MLVLAPKVSNLESEPLVEPLLLLLLLLQDILNPKLLTLALVQLYLSSAKEATAAYFRGEGAFNRGCGGAEAWAPNIY